MGERAVRGAVLAFLSSFSSLFLAAIGSIVVARVLGPSQYALISVSMVLPNLLLALTDLGINAAITRYASMARDSYVSSALFMRVSLGALAGLLVFLLAPYASEALGRPEVAWYVRLLSVFVFTHSLYTAAGAVLVGQGRFLEGALAGIAFTTIKVLTAVSLVLSGYGVLGALLSHVIAGLLVHVPMFLYAYRLSKGLSLRRQEASEILAYSLPLYLPSLIAWPLGQVYYGLMVRVSSNEEVGNLSVAYNFLAPINALAASVSLGLFATIPSITDRQQVEALIGKAMRTASFLLPAVSLGVALASQPLVYLLYGESYSLASLFLAAYMAGSLLSPLGSPLWSTYYAAVGRSDVVLKASLVQHVVSAPITVALILWGGALGYIVAGHLSGFVSTIYMLLSSDIKVGLRANALSLSPSLLSFTASLPFLLAFERPASWVVPSVVYVALLALTAPLLAGEEVVESAGRHISRLRFLGPLFSQLVSLDIKVAQKVWGIKEESS
ncbi:MAG: oligosaccharide flippase family protein [Acidilobaceae archaeon]|nr:oligosaccharide flippase family protein [Acidilobaceae archaeon]